MYNDSRQKDFFWGAMLGGTVAVLTSLLFTTKKGKEIRRKIADAYEDIEEAIGDQISDVSDEFEHFTKKVKDKIEDGVEHASRKVRDKIDDAADHIHKKTSHHK